MSDYAGEAATWQGAPFDNTAPNATQDAAALQQLLDWAQTLPDALLQGYLGEF